MSHDAGAALPLDAAQPPASTPEVALDVAADVVRPVWQDKPPADAWCPELLRTSLDPRMLENAAVEPCLVEARSGAWQVLGASVRGRSHAHRGEYRDDALATLTVGDLMLLAVADGAGSSALSRIGAAATAQMVVERTAERFAASAGAGAVSSRLGTAMAHAVHDAALHLHTLADTAALPPSAFRTTLLLVAVCGDLLLVSQVGDGAVLLQRTDGSVARIGATRATAWAGEVTCFVPEACAMTEAAALRQANAADVTLIALMTDGVDDPFHPIEQTGDALVSQWRSGTTAPIGSARQPEAPPVLGDARALLQWLAFEQRGEVDDRTLLLAWRAREVRA